jgi:hypothetical protein
VCHNVIGPPQRFPGLGYSHPPSNPSKNGINSENQGAFMAKMTYVVKKKEVLEPMNLRLLLESIYFAFLQSINP